MRKITKKDKRRLLVLVLIFIPLLTFFISNMFSYWSQIYKNVVEREQLLKEYSDILDEEDKLQAEIKKLSDLEYIAKYAREKYLYSKDGELIIKID